MPQYTNNYDYEAMDLNHDGYLDLITMNDGEHLDDGPYARRNHIFINDGKGGFVDATPKLWEDRDNPAVDDNLAVMLDYDSDGDPDVLVASLAGPDRVLINDGTGHLHLHTDWVNSFTGDPTHGTLGTAAAARCARSSRGYQFTHGMKPQPMPMPEFGLVPGVSGGVREHLTS